MIQNPFPGPQPYRASDRGRFYGREDLSYRLEDNVVANRVVTVYGPSGAGKSSLLQASVIPRLVESQEISVVRVDGWPEGEEPTRWLAISMYDQLGFGDLPADLSPGEIVAAAAKRAARQSSRLLLIYLDQIEQLLYPSRDTAEAEAFFENMHRMMELPLRNLRVSLSLREDYLGRFRDRLRDHGSLLRHSFRVGPLTVAELRDAVCQAAAAGEPPQTWDPPEMRALMLQVRVPGQAASDEAEGQAAYAQIVCRALFQERAAGNIAAGVVEAEPILRRYLDATLDDLGPLRKAAQQLLEDHLVSGDGTRTLRTEKELLRVLPSAELSKVLKALEGAAILHAEEHQGSRYFEIGHDWLARRVYELRQEREQKEAQAKLSQQQKEAEAALAKERAQRRNRVLAGASLVVAVITSTLGWYAWTQKEKADDLSILAGARELMAKNQFAWAIQILPEVKSPEAQSGWIGLASDALNANPLRATLHGHTAALRAAVFSPDGKRILTASEDMTARVWNADGTGPAVVLAGHTGPLVSAAFSPDGKRVVTASQDGTARVFMADGSGSSIELKGPPGALTAALFHADGKRVFTASKDGTVRSWQGDASGEHVVLEKGHTGAVLFPSADGKHLVSTSADRTVRIWDVNGKSSTVALKGPESSTLNHAAVSPDGKRVATAWSDGIVRVASIDGQGEPVLLEGNRLSVTFVAFQPPDGRYVAVVSSDKTVHLWPSNNTGPRLELTGHEAPVRSAVWSPDGSRVLTAASDNTAKVWSAETLKSAPATPSGRVFHAAFIGHDGQQIVSAYDDNIARLWSVAGSAAPVEFKGHDGWVANAALSPKGDRVVTASFDKTARIWKTDGTGAPVVLRGHAAEVRFAAFSPNDGARVVTVSDDKTARVWKAADGKLEAELKLKGHDDWLTSAAVSPDGARIVTTSLDGTARVWKADGAGEPVVLRGHRGEVLSAAWDSDSKLIVTTSADRTARIWNADSGAQVQVLRGHDDAVLRAVFGPDGKRVVTSSTDQAVRLWTTDDGWRSSPRSTELATKTLIIAMAFLDGGQTLLAVDANNTTHRWMLDVEKLKERLVTDHADCLPRAARETYLHENKDDAQKGWEQCEGRHLRIPLLPKGKAP